MNDPGQIPPPVYRPTKKIQPKMAAPPVYQPVKSVQSKMAAPPVYRPVKNMQPKMVAPPVYRPQVTQLRPLTVNPVLQDARARLILPPRLGRPALQTGGSVQRMCLIDAVKGLFGSCCGSTSASYAELEIEDGGSHLQEWGTATFLGYHKTSKWREIRQTGEFRTGDGKFGPGWYLVASDGGWVSSSYRSLTVWLEVGYVGDTSNWVVHTAESLLGYEESDLYDVIKTKNQTGPYNQVVYKPNGPSHITMQHFRVRKASKAPE